MSYVAVMSDLEQFGTNRQKRYPLAFWSQQHQLYSNYRYYADGWVFDEVVDTETVPGASVPKRYPLAVNFIQTLCLIHSSALWGQYDEHPLNIQVNSNPLSELGIISQEQLDIALLQGSFDCQVDGGVFFQVRTHQDNNIVSIVERPASYVYPVWHPEDPDNLLEVILAFEIDAEQAKSAYGIRIDGDRVVYKEIWTPTSFEIVVGDSSLGQADNPLGIVPFVYIPRLRSNNEFYGISLVRDLVGMQDEINLRMADLGDQVNYEAHAIKWVRNYSRGNPTADLPLSGDVVWDLGAAIGSDKDPEAGVLSGQALPNTSLEYVRMIKELLMNNAFVGPVDFGEDEGSQRSGATLHIRKEPVTRLARWGRVYWRNALNKILKIAINAQRIRKQEEISNNDSISVTFAPLLPRDRADLINELVQLAGIHGISIERILDKLGDVEDTDTEIANIHSWIEYLQTQGVKNQPASATQ